MLEQFALYPLKIRTLGLLTSLAAVRVGVIHYSGMRFYGSAGFPLVAGLIMDDTIGFRTGQVPANAGAS
jgi:hypothetical protein